MKRFGVYALVLLCFAFSVQAYGIGRSKEEFMDIILGDTFCQHGNIDLSSLEAATDYQDQDSGANNYFINFCRDAKVGCMMNGARSNGPMCQQDTSGSYHGCGLLDDWTWADQTYGVDVTYTGGDCCHECTFNRTTVFKFHCNESETIKIHMIEEDPTEGCRYFVTVDTKYACGGSPPGPPLPNKFQFWIPSFGTVCLFFSFIALILYIIIGIIVQIFVFKRRGFGMIPNKDFWTIYFIGIKDGWLFTYLRTKDVCVFLYRKTILLYHLIRIKVKGGGGGYETFT